MAKNDLVYFGLDNFNVSMDIQDGQVVGVSATDADGNSYDVGFFLERIPSGGCMICRKIGGVLVCQDIQCDAVVPTSSSDKRD